MATTDINVDVLALTRRAESGEKIEGADLSRAVRRFTQLEVETGGPYAAVMGGKADIGVSLAVARFLKTQDITLPKLEAYIDTILSSGKIPHSVLGKKVMDGLIAWRTRPRPKRTNTKAKLLTREEMRVMSAIRDAAKERFKGLTPELKQSALYAMERTISANPDKQMSLMSLYTKQALGELARKVRDEHLGRLGLANIFFWSAFVIYDDFWDEDEAADPKILPTANLFARHYTDFFSTLMPAESGFREFFHATMDRLDGANAWETARCRAEISDRVFTIPETLPRYGDFGVKFWPAGGHILGPVSIVLDAGFALKSREVKNFIAYFTHYLVAMQLNDDMHDWKEDLERGHISTAVSVLLGFWSKRYPKRRDIHLVNDMPLLEEVFWFSALRPLCEAALAHSHRSREALRSVKIFEDPTPLERYIVRNEKTANEALSEYHRSRDFLQGFS